MKSAQRPFQSRLRRVLLAVLRFPFWLSLSAFVSGPAPREIAGLPTLPGLVFDQYLVDFPEIEPREEVIARFAFKNVGKQKLKIKKLVPSCGCLQPQLRKFEFNPGETGYFHVRVQTANQNPGTKSTT